METPTILLVDDELTNVKVLVDFLKDEGFKAVHQHVFISGGNGGIMIDVV